MHCVGKVLKKIVFAVARPLGMGRPADEHPVHMVPSIDAKKNVLVGRFHITGKLGEGANGLVFSAEDLAGGPNVAIKISNPTNKEAAKLLRVRFNICLLFVSHVSHFIASLNHFG
jgi:serine/threonine protein kinase